MGEQPSTPTPVTCDSCAHIESPFYHGTKSALEVDAELVPGYGSNFQEGRVSNNLYFSALVETAAWGAELVTAPAGRGWFRRWRTGLRSSARTCPDLPGDGDSDRLGDGPAGVGTSLMAGHRVTLRQSLGPDRLAVVGHDRGALVASRAALDHPKVVI